MSDTRPNILVIMPDQMRGDCLSLEGHPAVSTPNLDAIGARGTHFRRAYTTCASCIPARRCLLTGQFPMSSGMVGFRGGFPLEVPTLPQALAGAGYQTAIAGRYMHQDPYEEPYGFQKRVLGSTYVDGDDYDRWLAERFPESGGVKGHGLTFNGWTARPWQLPDWAHPTNWVVEQSARLLAEAEPQQPLFLCTSFYAPHPPLFPPAAYMARYLDRDLPPAAIGDWAARPAGDGVGFDVDSHVTVLEGAALRTCQAGYYGLINHIDDQLYWLLARFKGLSQAQRRPWIVWVCSDHGEMLGDHYFFRKCEPYEGSSRIPFSVEASPELGFARGQVSSHPVCLEDMMPTLLAAAGVDCPDTVDGQSLLSLLRGEEQKVRPWLHGEHAPCYSQEQAYHFLTDGREKYIWRPTSGTEQLFDLEADPQECRDLAREGANLPQVHTWRKRLIEQLIDRPEGFTDGSELIPGRPYEAVMPHLKG